MFQCAIIWLIGLVHCLTWFFVLFVLRFDDPCLTTRLWSICSADFLFSVSPVFSSEPWELKLKMETSVLNDNKTCFECFGFKRKPSHMYDCVLIGFGVQSLTCRVKCSDQCCVFGVDAKHNV